MRTWLMAPVFVWLSSCNASGAAVDGSVGTPIAPVRTIKAVPPDQPEPPAANDQATVADGADPADLEKEVREVVIARVAEGFESRADIVAGTVDLLSEDFDQRELRAEVKRIVEIELVAQRQREQAWTTPTDCDRLDAAFAELERTGILARQNYEDCQTCGSAAIAGEMDARHRAGKTVRGYVYYHQQDTEAAVEGDLYLAYGAHGGNDQAVAAVAREVVRTLARHGLKVRWDNDVSKRIVVQLDWKRRRFTRPPRR